MSASISDTLRSYRGDVHRRAVYSIIVCSSILTAWIVWAFTAKVPIYAVSQRTIVSSQAPVVLLNSPAEGVVALVSTGLGRAVTAGELLLQLETDQHEHVVRVRTAELQQAISRESVAGMRLQSAAKILELNQEDSRNIRERVSARSEEIAAENNKALRVIDEQLALDREGLLAKNAAQDAAQERVRLKSRRQAYELSLKEELTSANEKTLGLRERTLELMGAGELANREVSTARERLRAAQFELSRHSIRSPVQGSVIRWDEPAVGTTIRSNQVIGAVIPLGATRIHAFVPRRHLGVLRVGMRGYFVPAVAISGEQGSVPAVVDAIAPENGTADLIKIVLRPTQPLPHGTQGTTHIELMRVTLARLLWDRSRALQGL